MVYLMLDYLCGKTVIDPGMTSEFLILKSNVDLTVPFCFSNTGKRQTAFFCFIFAEFCRDFRVHHHHLPVPLTEDDNSFSYADHVRGHTDAAIQIGPKGIQQINNDLSIRFVRRIGWLGEKVWIMYNRTYHIFLYRSLNANNGRRADRFRCLSLKRFCISNLS